MWNPCLNQDHQQLESNMVAAHNKAMIKAQFRLLVASIQARIMEKFGYEISYKKALHENIKHLLNYLVTFISYMQSCHIFSLP